MLYREWLDVTGIKIKKKQTKKQRECGQGTLNMHTVFIYLTKVNINDVKKKREFHSI